MNDTESPDLVIVPHTELAPDTLRRLVESFVLSEGTDDGSVEFLLEQKVAHVMAQLERDDARILFDPDTASVTIATARDSRA